MMEPLSTEQLRNLAAGYVTGNLDAEESEQLQRLLPEHPELEMEIHQLQNVLETVVRELNQAEPPQRLRSAISSIIQTSTVETSAIETSAVTARPQSIGTRWKFVLGSVAAILLVVVGYDNYRLRQELHFFQSLTAMLQDSESSLFLLKGTGALENVGGRAMIDLDEGRVMVALQKLPTPPKGSVYWLWADPSHDQTPISCGPLIANAKGEVLSQLQVPIQSYQAGVARLFITVEPSMDVSQPTGKVALVSE